MSTGTRRIFRYVFVIGLFAWLIFSSIFRNSVRVYIGENVSQNYVLITWLSEDTAEQILFKKQRSVSDVGNDYGMNIFHIYYHNKKASVRHFKTRWWHMHKYEFKVLNDNCDIYVEFTAKGSDGVSERVLVH